jgi:hypothetical protein
MAIVSRLTNPYDLLGANAELHWYFKTGEQPIQKGGGYAPFLLHIVGVWVEVGNDEL